MDTAKSGPCFEFVLNRIAAANGEAAADSTRTCAIALVDKCVGAYAGAFGGSDVGRDGSCTVSRPFKPTTTSPVGAGTNGLLYGRVQSGKTNASIATVALAHANGFRCFVILTSDNTWLGSQTATRFRDGLMNDGPVVRQWEDWQRDPQGLGRALRSYVGDTGIALISTKNARHLENLRRVLEEAECSRVPAMIIDDEADNASLNTSTARQSRLGANQVPSSRIFSLIGDIRSEIPNHVFLQVTATPQSLLLQGLDTPMRPQFCVIAPIGEDYVGGDVFFREAPEHLVAVDPMEINDLKSGRVNPGDSWAMPAGLRKAICCLVLGAAYHELRPSKRNDGVYSMLVHIDHRKVHHHNVGLTIANFVALLDQALRGKLSATRLAEAERILAEAYDELHRTEPGLPPLTEMRKWIESRLRNANPQIIDADNPRNEPEYKPGLNVLIGGNRLGRGVTIRGLMVTYYGRDPKVKMMDTVHQHARMFGYRRHLLSVTRLFSANNLLGAFRAIHLSDEGTRELIDQETGGLHVKPVWVGPNLRPTRASVLNPADLGVIRGQSQIYPPSIRTKASEIAGMVGELDELLAKYTDEDVYYPVSIDELIEIVSRIPTDPIPSYSWEDERVVQVLRALQAHPIRLSSGAVNVNRGRQGIGGRATRNGALTSGFISGQQDRYVKQKLPFVPVLIVRREQGLKEDGWDGHAFWAPTLILPRSDFAFMFSY